MSNLDFPELQQLLGLPFTKATRLGQIQYFHFGKAQVTNSNGLVLDVGAWTLEVSCMWEIQKAGTVAIAYQEVELPREFQALPNPAFNPQVPGSTLRDRKLQELIQKPELKVLKASASAAGVLEIELEENTNLLINPGQGILESEPFYWSLFSNIKPKETVSAGVNGLVKQ
ncbi:hypothetical protein [Adhaeribacter aquaticus]|uniref:hypothetical protein n=1 Tax=Adhaeribacter aquaticus TaxID=299567 RepID=UPI000420983F|nr:hypothetical protein [Adhaeribacter aquaticus]